MLKFIKAADGISEWSGRIFSLLFYPGLLILVFEVFMRYVFDAPTLWGWGTAQRIFAVYLVTGGGYVALHEVMVRMDVFYNKWTVRRQEIVNAAAMVLMITIAFVLVYFGVRYFMGSLRILEVDNTPFRAPLWPVKFFIPLGGLFLGLQGVANLYRHIKNAIAGKKEEVKADGS